MKSGFLVILALLLNYLPAVSQEKDVDFNYFFYGTFLDYMGRERCFANPDNVDSYANFENALMKYNFEHLKKYYPDLSIVADKNLLSSKVLTAQIDKLFNYTFEDGFCSAREDKNGNPIDSVFTGKIKTDIFKTKLQKISYLVGAYVRHGGQKDKLYTVRIANSISTFPACMKLLKELGCKDIKSEITESVPFNYYIEFTPTDELKYYLSKYQFLRNQIAEARQKQLHY